jgi:hypothetical protein
MFCSKRVERREGLWNNFGTNFRKTHGAKPPVRGLDGQASRPRRPYLADPITPVGPGSPSRRAVEVITLEALENALTQIESELVEMAALTD